MALKAYKRVLIKFNWDTVGEEVINHMKSLL